MNTTNNILIVEDQFVEANHLRLMLKKAGYAVLPIARSVEEAKTLIEQQKPDLVLLDIFLSGKETGIDLARHLKKEQIGFIYLSANSNEDILNEAKATQPFGFLVKPFREKDLLITMQIAAYHQEHGLDSSFRKEAFFQRQLKSLQDVQGGRQKRLMKLIEAIQPLIPYDFAIAVLKTPKNDLTDITGFLRMGLNEYQIIGIDEFQLATKLKTHELQNLMEQVPVESAVSMYTGSDFEKITEEHGMKNAIKKHFGMRSNLILPITLGDPAKHFFFSFFSRQPSGFSQEHVELCERLQFGLTGVMRNVLFEMDQDAPKGHVQPSTMIAAGSHAGLAGIIGKSRLLMNVFDHLIQVAPAETSVLITGESGTGKESIADNIHQLSPRKKGPLVKINCAALPPNLIESELFGHEKGAFTGAIDRRIGKFEQADKGTLFLDEIGEMPLEMQAKMLRVLQQKEIERLGGREPIKINVRIIAATNRNLEKEVAEGRFRLDLYYRLNVFPLHLPALRDRPEDIEALAIHFLQMYSSKNDKDITGFSLQTLSKLKEYAWPGNIRELENLIERTVLMTKGTEISSIELPQTKKGLSATEGSEGNEAYLKTIEENEREHILLILRKCNGRIRGQGGAAEILGVPPTTLASKIKKLGIKKDFFSGIK